MQAMPCIFAAMARYFLRVIYDGTAFHGSQLQGELPTVQLAINKALSTLLRKNIESFGASRTDEGVHALCNYYHFDTNVPLHDAFMYKMNAILPAHVSVSNVYLAESDNLNARFDAITRRYRYRIYFKKNPFLFHRALYFPFRINKDVLHATAEEIKKHTDFETFCKRNSQSRTFTCTIHQSYWEQYSDELHYVVEANRFLRGMVRGLVSTQLQVAKGRTTLEEFRKIIEAKNCTKADFSVAGYGLYLESISYPEGSLKEITDIQR